VRVRELGDAYCVSAKEKSSCFQARLQQRFGLAAAGVKAGLTEPW